MNWRNYLITTDRRTFIVRAISERDARYVAEHPCKRNGGRPPLHDYPHHTIVKVEAR